MPATRPLHRSVFRVRHAPLVLLLLLQSAFIPLCKATADTNEVWLLVDTRKLTLAVMRGEARVQE